LHNDDIHSCPLHEILFGYQLKESKLGGVTRVAEVRGAYKILNETLKK
jgi:hypothetical protein